MSKQEKQLYGFGQFSIDASERVLLRNGQPVPLTPKAFDLLLALVESKGHLVEKDELMRKLWPDTFVEETNLSNNISLLRKALTAEGAHQYIETVPRRGYRFVLGVAVPADEPPELIIEERSRSTLTYEENTDIPVQLVKRERTGQVDRSLVIPLIAVALVTLALAAYLFWPNQAASFPPIRSIAVLPFKPLVADHRDESLEMGMAETLITRLSSIKELAVRPVSAVRKYNVLEQDPVLAGTEQKVDAVLDGSIQKTDARVRVTVRLIRVRDGQTLWADKFDERLADIFALQDSISEKVAAAMALKISSEEKQLLTQHHTDNPEAYQLYLRGRIFYRQQTEDAVAKALDCFERAIALDPNYALAYTGKADLYSAYSSVFLAPALAMPKARESAHRALVMDDRLAEAHYSMARVKLWADWDWSGAESEYKRALEIKPNDAEIRVSYTALLSQQKRFDEALVELKRVLEIEPVSPFVIDRAARMPYFARRYDQALAQSRDVVAFHPNQAIAFRDLAAVLTELGMYEEAIAAAQKAVDLQRHSSYITQLGYTLARAGKKREAIELARELEELRGRRYVSPVHIARIYSGLGEKEIVFKWLHKGYEDRSDHLLWLDVDPTFDVVRTDPRFQDLLRSLGLR